MNIKRLFILIGAICLGMALTITMLWLFSGSPESVRAASYTVCLEGPPTCDYGSIQEAIDAAGDNDMLELAAQEFTESITVDKSITIQGVDDDSTIIQAAAGPGIATSRVITVTEGVSVTISNIRVRYGDASRSRLRPYQGGGILTHGTLRLENSTIISNTAQEGGGIYIFASALTSPTIISNTKIISNSSGGGIRAVSGPVGANIKILHNEIRGNAADYNGDGLSLGFVSGPTSNMVVESNMIVNNGWGVSMEGSISLTNNIIANNIYGGVLAHGGGEASWLINNTIVDNESDGVRYDNAGDMVLHLTNNIVAGNTGYGISIEDEGSPKVSVAFNNVWGNGSGNYCCHNLPDQTGINGNISRIPMFVDPLIEDWHLSPCSPAIDTGTNTGAPATDFEGDARPFNGLTDMGADEYMGDGECFPLFLPCINRNLCPDFFDDFSDPASGWEVIDNEFEHTEYLDSEYRVAPKVMDYVYLYRAPTCIRQDYIVDVDARWASTPGGSYGIFFGALDDYSRYYRFEVDTDSQNFLVRRRDSSGWTDVVPWTYTPAINVGTSSNHLKLFRNGIQFELEVNGVILGSWGDYNLTGSSYVGVTTYPYYEQPTYDVRFDNFSVISLPSSSTELQDRFTAPPDH